MKLSDNELKIILSQLPIIEIDTAGEYEMLTDTISEDCGDYTVEFQVRVRSTRHSPSMELEGRIWSVSHYAEFWNIAIYLDDEHMIPMDKQEEIFEEIVRPKLDIR